MLSESKTPKTGFLLEYSKTEPIYSDQKMHKDNNFDIDSAIKRQNGSEREKKHTAAMAVIAEASR